MFAPIGDESRRDILTRLVDRAEHGHLFTYEELREQLHAGDTETVQKAVNGARMAVEKATSKTLINVRNTGYRVAEPSEHVEAAVAHQRKSVRQIHRAKSKVDNVDLAGLTPAERAAVGMAAMTFAAQIEFMRRADARYAQKQDLESLAAMTREGKERTDAQVNDLKARLERLESRL